jgi:hypothetical protein
MSTIIPSSLLRFALRLDGWASALAGLLTCLLRPALTPLLGAPPSWVMGLGFFMLGYGLLIAWTAGRERLPSALVWTLVIGNSLWVVASIALAWSSWIDPTALGRTLILVQAGLVLVFAELEYLGLRRSDAGRYQRALSSAVARAGDVG